MTKNTETTSATPSRGNLYTFNPFELAIAGGKGVLKGDEAGPLDTAYNADENDPLCNAGQLVRLNDALDEAFCANVDMYGVQVAIKVIKRNGIFFVVFGRTRVRAARRAYARRQKCGEPVLGVPATIWEGSRNDSVRLAGVIAAENAARKDDDFTTTMINVRDFMARGVSIEDCAVTFKMKPAQLKRWIAFDDNAADEVRVAVANGLSISAGMEVVAAGDAAAQLEALKNLQVVAATNGGKATTTAARKAAKKTKGEEVAGIRDRKTLRKLVQAIRDAADARRNATPATIAFWEGAENMLMAIVGEVDDKGKPEADRRILDMVAKLEGAE